jgi:hypothetical protein
VTEGKRQVISLSDVAAGYQTRVSLYTFVGSTIEVILRSDARRYAVRFVNQGIVNWSVEPTPGPMPNPLPAGASSFAGEMYKFADCPSWVIGDWYGRATAGMVIIIWECLKVG